MQRPVHGVPITGVDVDPETRCAHYDAPRDVLAVRFPCCERYYPCHDCHETVADHDPAVWSPASFGRRAILCGVCGTQQSIAEYLAAPDACPACEAPFNPGCVDHHHLYFDLTGSGATTDQSGGGEGRRHL